MTRVRQTDKMGFPRRRTGNRQSGSSQKTNESRNTTDKKSKTTSTPSAGKYIFQIHGQKTKQSNTYAKVKENLILKVQATFKNPNLIVKSIREKAKHALTEPTRKRIKSKKNATEEQLADARFQQQTCDMEYRVELEEYRKKKDEFDEEWSKGYALIFYNYCSSEMRTAVKELPTFEKDIRDDPLELLTAIEKLMVTPVKACYPLATLAETLSSLLNLR